MLEARAGVHIDTEELQARQEMQEEQYRYNKNPFSLQEEVRRPDSMYTCIQM